ncbi:MAG: 1-acyl-sn-glycerol-3-phosphate acyltransferase, partial [Chloroflexota bacterium]
MTRVRVLGRENIPQHEGYLAAANHLSIIEVPLVYCLIARHDVTGLVARKHNKNPFFRWIVNMLGGIWLSRDEIDTRALRDARDHLRSGGVLGIAPEGTRSD